jgi:hypothetical protein
VNGKAKLDSSARLEEPTVLEAASEDDYTCDYGFKTFEGAVKLHSFENHELLEVSFVNQKFKLSTKQAGCPTQLAMTAPFQYTVKVEPGFEHFEYYVFAEIL